MQSSANVQLTPKEDVTVSVAANDLCDGIEGSVGVAGMAWLAVSDGDEGIPLVPTKEPTPSLF